MINDRAFKVFGVLILFFSVCLFYPTKSSAQLPEISQLSVPSATPEESPLPSAESDVPVASASAPINLTLSPITLFLETNPGDPVQGTIKIRNNSKDKESLKISFGTFTADETGDHPKLLDPGPNDEFMNWISAEPSKFLIPPDSWQTVNITFSPPKDSALSYYYTIMVDRIGSDSKPGEAVIKGTPALLSLAYVRSPNAVRQLELASFEADSPVLEYLPQTFKVKLKNTGNVHSVPAGNVFIDGQGKTDIAVLSLNPKSSTVLPNSQRTLEVTWDDGFPVRSEKGDHPANGFTFLNSFWDFSKADRFRMGKYTAHLLMVYDNGERDVPVESFISFWVIPWKILLAGLLVVILVILGVRSIVLLILSLFRRGKSLHDSPASPS